MKPPLSYLPMLPAAVGIAIGIIIHPFIASWLCAILCIAAFCACYFLNRQYLAFFFLLTLVGYALALLHSPPQIESYPTAKASFNAKIITSAETTNGQRLLVEAFKVDNKDINPMLCLIETPSHHTAFDTGCYIEFTGIPAPLPAPSVVPDAIDYYNRWRQLGVTAYFKINPSEIKIIAGPNAWHSFVNKMRNGIYNGIVDSPISGKCAAFLLGAILGDRQYVDYADIHSYQMTGVAHILALSGLHIAIIAALLSFLLIPLKLHRKGYIIRAILIIILIWSYAVIVGLSDSVVRASTMITVFLVSQILQRGYYSANSLCFAFVAILIFSPQSLYNIGFQMSFAAVASILLFVNLMPKHLRQHQTAYYLINLLAMPIAAMFGTGLISAYYFHIMPIMFLLSNIIVGLIFPMLLTLGILLTILTLFGAFVPLFGKFVDFLYILMQSGIQSVAEIKTFDGIYFSPLLILPYMLALALFAWAFIYKKRLWAIWGTSALVVAVIICLIYKPNYPKMELYIPSELGGDIIMRKGSEAFIVNLNGNQESKQTADKIYLNFLAQRCNSNQFVKLNDSILRPSIAFKDNVLQFDATRIVIVDDAMIERNQRSSVHCNYAIVSGSFTKSISDILETVSPDTILLSAKVPGSRAKRLIREAGEVVPVFKIRQHPVSMQKWE